MDWLVVCSSCTGLDGFDGALLEALDGIFEGDGDGLTSAVSCCGWGGVGVVLSSTRHFIWHKCSVVTFEQLGVVVHSITSTRRFLLFFADGLNSNYFTVYLGTFVAFIEPTAYLPFRECNFGSASNIRSNYEPWIF